MVREQIARLVADALTRVGIPVCEVEVGYPEDSAHGDATTNVALRCAKERGEDPRAVALALVEAIDKPDWIDAFEVAGPGFINVRFTRTYFRDSIRTVLAEGDRYGAHRTLTGKRVMVEHTQPNPFKPFHIGHLMSNTLGESISRLYRFSGADVRTVNYQGDVGLHVAKCLWGLRKLGGDAHSIEDLGRAYVEGNRAYEDEAHARDEIVSYNRMVYEHAHDVREEYRAGREVSLAHFEELYRMLGTRFDHYFFESETQVPGRVLVKEGIARGVFKESDGAVVFPGEEHGLHTRVFLTREGLPTYEAKELGLAELKAEKWPFDLSLTTTAVEQADYFKVVFAALSLLRPELAGKLIHVPHGMMVLESGKMSSRKGNIVTGESLLSLMLEHARDKVRDRELPPDEKEAVARAVAVAAIKYSILKQKAGKNITFSPERSLSLEGDSGPYLEYAHTRAVSLLEKARVSNVAPSTELAPAAVTPVERLLHRFPDVVLRAREAHEPHYVTTYLIELAAVWNAWYAAERVLDESPTAPYKLAVVSAVRHTLKNGLWLLGIEAPEKM